jgi:hypothetical protein
MVRNLALNLHKESHSATSNNRASDNSMKMNYKEEETVHQLNEPMNLEQQNSFPSDMEQDEANSNQVFTNFHVLQSY